MARRASKRRGSILSNLIESAGSAVANSLAMRDKHGRPDLVLLAVLLGLLILGIDMVYSASYAVAHNSTLYGGDDTYFLTRQVIWVGIGLIGMYLTMKIDYHYWRRISLPLLAVVILMLIAVSFTSLGREVYGAQRWLSLGPLPAIQPSEFAKLALIIYFADWLSRQPGRTLSFSHGTLPFAVVLAIVAGMVLKQNDLGSTLIIMSIGVSLFFIGGANVRHFMLGIIAGSAVLVLSIFATGYRAERLSAFLDPTKDPSGAGWHTIQTNIALGSGGLFGLGLGASRQKFFWLPAAHTDAIFAVIGEELGLLGTSVILGLFLLLGYRGLKIMLTAPDPFGRLLAGGITIWIVVQALVNMAVVTSLIPFTGIPLPFLSSGGSSMTISLFAMGILLNVSRQATASNSARRRGRATVV